MKNYMVEFECDSNERGNKTSYVSSVRAISPISAIKTILKNAWHRKDALHMGVTLPDVTKIKVKKVINPDKRMAIVELRDGVRKSCNIYEFSPLS